ncbi:MAG: phage tail protein I [Oscillospiraceae bacterium]|nr:phage tail protein I [Oscillospiraceae bacterium]
MKTTIKDVDLLQILPFFMRGDEANAALSRAVNRLVNVPGAKIPQLRVWDMIDKLDHENLDELAWELNIEWYDKDLPIESKRETIKAAQRVQATLGTKYAVETALNAIYPDTAVKEWFEYGGDPYTFRIQIKAAADAEKQAQVLEQIRFYKNLRSHLDEIVYRIPIEGEARYYCGVRSIYKYKKIIAGVSHFNN